MQFEQAKPFLASNHRAVVNTLGAGGAIQSSIVVCGAYQDYMAFVSVSGRSAKIRNLRRNSRCTVVATSADWRNYVVVEGEAQLFDSANTPAEELRQKLRDVFKVCGDGTHSDWDEYDRIMGQQEAVVVLVTTDRVYGLLR